MRKFPLFLIFFLKTTQSCIYDDCPVNEQLVLYCNDQVIGNFNNMITLFKRPMRPGDRIIVNGTMWTEEEGAERVTFDLIAPLTWEAPLHMRQMVDLDYSIFASFEEDWWLEQEYGPRLFSPGENYEYAYEYLETGVHVYKNDILQYTFNWRHNHTTVPPTIQGISATASHVINWMMFNCTRC